MTGKYFSMAGNALLLSLALSGAMLQAQEARRSGSALRPSGERGSEDEKAALADGKARVTGVRLLSSPTYTRITIDLTQAVRYETGRIPEDAKRNLPPRIYVDIIGTRLAVDSTEPIPVQDGLVRQVRIGQNSDNNVRVVLDLNSLRDHRTFILPDPYRLVIDIQGVGNRAAESTVASVERNRGAAPAPAEINKPAPPPVERSKAPAPPAEKNKTLATLPGIRKIVLDPGHGGKDPGAVGVDGAVEKEIVLRVAKKLAAKLQKDMGIQVVLTRKDDSFVPLENRTAIANAENADLFISLHMNAAPTGEAKGVETYYLDNTSDEASLRLAARENSTARGKISDLQFILSDMAQNSKLEDSVTLAHNLHGSLVDAMTKKSGEVRDLGVKKALFFVLVGARMPSVLLEMFFITNKTEGRAMAQESYQDAVADALYDGVLKYNQSTLAVKTL